MVIISVRNRYDVRNVRTKLHNSYNNIISFFPMYIAQNFFKVHSTQEYRRMCNESKKIDNKIRLLKEKEFKKKLQNIKPITYDISTKKEESITNISPNSFSDSNSLDSIQMIGLLT